MLITPLAAAVAGFSPVLSLTTETRSPSSSATSSRIRDSALQGPHQGAGSRQDRLVGLQNVGLEGGVRRFGDESHVGRSFPGRDVGRCGWWGPQLRGEVRGRSCRRGAAAPGQVALGVESRRAPGAGRGDGLAVGVVDQVAAGEHPGEVGAGRRRFDLTYPWRRRDRPALEPARCAGRGRSRRTTRSPELACSSPVTVSRTVTPRRLSSPWIVGRPRCSRRTPSCRWRTRGPA